MTSIEHAHTFGRSRVSQTQARAATSRAIADLLRKPDEFWAQIARRVILQAVLEATPLHWIRRAEQLEGVGTPSADEAARNCRRHAWLLTEHGPGKDATAELSNILREVA